MNNNSFKTYAVFDIETTGLPHLNFNKVNIIEFSVSTISKDDLLKLKKEDVPRVINKLSLLFNPQMVIQPESSEITGLDNYQLEHENAFDENAATTIIGFFKHLQGPICLIAHNGDRFDFPILKKAFEKVNLSLPENVFCVDSYKAIPYIDHTKKENEKQKKNKKETEKLLDLDEPLFENFESKVNPLEEKCDVKSKLKEENFNIQKINETTPRRPTTKIRNFTNSNKWNDKQNRNDVLSNHSETSSNSFQNKEEKKIKRELFKEFADSDSISQTPKTTITIPRSPKGYYTLSGIFKRIFYVPKSSHHAEADVEMLQKIIINYGEDFVKYSEENAIPFSKVKSLGSKI